MAKKRKNEHHQCSLGLGSDIMLPKIGGPHSRIRRRCKKCLQVSQHHPDTYDYFYSFPAVLAERQRHTHEAGSCMIHPFSIFNLMWRTFMIVVNLSHMTLSTLRLCYIIEPMSMLHVHFCDHLLLAINLICMIDIIIHFHTGYKEKTSDGTKMIVTNMHLIFWNYIRGRFLIEFISCLPISYSLLTFFPSKPRFVFVAHLLHVLRTLIICAVVRDIRTFVKVFAQSYIWVGIVCHVIIFLLTAHWCSCILYIPPVSCLYWNGYVPANHTRFLKHPGGILHFPLEYRYKKSIFIAFSGFFATGFSMFKSTESEETLLHALIILYCDIFVVYNFVFMLKMYMTIYSSTIRYNELMNQVEEYMTSKQFPSQLRKRVRAHYSYLYQEQYFSESSVLSSLSEELRNDIRLHTCYKLVDKVAIFKDVAADVVGSVLGCLKPEVYLPNDSVLRAGDVGDCMYFIANGTVAVYSLKGVEVCHLEDGAHFGEVALLMKDSKRVSTVVAVEITELYRLDGNDFRQFIIPNEILYQRIEAIASMRMHETVLLDEELRKEREKSETPTQGT